MDSDIRLQVEKIYLSSIKNIDTIKSMNDAYQVGIDVAHILRDIYANLVRETDPQKKASNLKEFSDVTSECFEKVSELHKKQIEKIQKQTLFWLIATFGDCHDHTYK